jgi:hypothetical protein
MLVTDRRFPEKQQAGLVELRNRKKGKETSMS